MASIQESLTKLLDLDGAIAAALADSDSGMSLGSVGTGLDIESAVAGNTEVVRSKRRTVQLLGLDQEIEDILITLERQLHIIRPLRSNPAVFIYLALDRSRANLGLARLKVQEIEKSLEF